MLHKCKELDPNIQHELDEVKEENIRLREENKEIKAKLKVLTAIDDRKIQSNFNHMMANQSRLMENGLIIAGLNKTQERRQFLNQKYGNRG